MVSARIAPPLTPIQTNCHAPSGRREFPKYTKHSLLPPRELSKRQASASQSTSSLSNPGSRSYISCHVSGHSVVFRESSTPEDHLWSWFRFLMPVSAGAPASMSAGAGGSESQSVVQVEPVEFRGGTVELHPVLRAATQ